MRQRLSLLVVAVTSMVVLAFVVPLALTVEDQVETRALNRGQRTAQSVASGLAVAASLAADGTIDGAMAELVVVTSGDSDTSVVLPDGTILGAPLPLDTAVSVAAGGRGLTVRDDDGAAILIPVSTAAGALVVRTFVPAADLTAGVGRAWLGLAALGAVLIAAAALVADRLGRNLVQPVGRLADAARSMAGGDLEARVEPAGPPEIADVGHAFNHLAERLDDLLAAERESVADLSHGLRTPLTALRLQAELLDDPEAAAAMVADVDRLGRQIDALITEARRPSEGAGRRRSDLGVVVGLRAAFWEVLAEEQGRSVTTELPAGPLVVAVPERELATAVDTLFDNVFTHTEAGVAYAVSVAAEARGGRLIIDDAGPGFPAADLVERGRSGTGGTGLGLDIVRRTARRSGGELAVRHSPLGGTRVDVLFGSPEDPSR